jgi:hypothetical protein
VTAFATGRVLEILEQRPGLQRITVEFEDSDQVGDRAYCLTKVIGEVEPGDLVLLNTTAVELGLGTGGWHVVHWNLARRSLDLPGPDHIMKMRYTSLQCDVGTDELLYPDVPAELGGMPVVGCQLHSQMGIVACTIKQLAPSATVAYVMTDGAALPLALSDLAAELKDHGLLDVTATAGHAFGGDLEAVTVESALCLARHVARADIAIVAMGPGAVGTGTALGTTAIEVAAVLDHTESLGGEPVLCVRTSSGDERSRHRGVSHHVTSALSLMTTAPWVAPGSDDIGPAVRVRGCDVPAVDDILGPLDLEITTMGRAAHEDPAFFEAAVGAGAVAVDLLALT